MPLISYKTDDLCFKMDNNYKIVGSRKSTFGLHVYSGEFSLSPLLISIAKYLKT